MNGRETCVEVDHAIVLVLPRVHPNTTKQKFAHCYQLRAPVKAVDRLSGLFSSGARVSAAEGLRSVGMAPKARRWHNMCLQVLLGLYMPNIHSLFVLDLHRHRFLSPILSTYRVNLLVPTNGRESYVEVVDAIVLGNGMYTI